jgi:hypothetical protein
MSGQRANAFENLAELPVFNVKPKAEKPVAKEAVDEIPEPPGTGEKARFGADATHIPDRPKSQF